MRLLVILMFGLFASVSFSQKVKTVEAEYTYYAPENITLEQARRTALKRAKIQAIADEFGTIISQSNATRIENKNGVSQTDFLSIDVSEVKGEWIETLSEEMDNPVFEGGMVIIKCRVKGKAREIMTAQIDFRAKILRNGVEDKYEDCNFRSGDDLYLSFQSPVKGNLAVYLVDDDRQAFCLLPYRNQADGIYPVKANQPYLFFNERLAPQEERSYVDEYNMTCKRSSEHNQIYIIFSPNHFAKAVDNNTNESLPRQLSYKDFNQWLVKCRKHDKDMNMKMIPITITK